MSVQKNIVAVIPAYNESNTIVHIIQEVLTYCSKIVVVNDCSTDETKELLEKLNNDKVEIIHNIKNLGIGGSMKLGFKRALKTNPDIVIKIDADGQHKPSDIPFFVDKLINEDLSLVKGNRFFDIESLENMPKIKVFGNLITTNLQKIVSGNYKVSDPNNGFLAIRSSSLKKVNFKHLHNNYFFENSLIIVFNALNLKIGEIGIETIYNDEKSSIPVLKAALQMIPVFIFFLFRKNVITAKHQLSANSMLFFILFMFLIANMFLNSQALWFFIVLMIVLYIFVDVLNFLSR